MTSEKENPEGPPVRRPVGVFNRMFHQPGTTPYRIVDAVVWLLILASVVLVALELFAFDRDDLPPWIRIADDAILWCFAAELALRVLTLRPKNLNLFKGGALWKLETHFTARLRYIFTPLVLLDVLVVLTFIPALRGLRALRLFRLLRGVRFFRYSNPIMGIFRAFHENALLYIFTFGFLAVVVVLGGTTFYFVEAPTNEKVQTLSDGIWWALVTLTTVGYGDVTPGSEPLSRIIGGGVMLAGMFNLALFAGIVGSTLLRVLINLRQDQFRMSNYSNHLVICGYDSTSKLVLDAVMSEIDLHETEVVVFGPGDRPTSLPPELIWISGDPTRENELDKVRLSHARGLIIVSGAHETPSQADANTLMVIFTVRSYMASHPDTPRRNHPLYVVAEVLDPENVAHARAAGADEAIETTRLGYSLIMHAAMAPGTGAVMSKVASAEAHSLYIAKNPHGEDVAYDRLTRDAHDEHRVTLIGIRDPRTGRLTLNPDDQEVVAPDHEVVYLAKAPVLTPKDED